MPRADFLALLRQRETVVLAALAGLAGLVALAAGIAALRGLISPRAAMIFAALLCALASAWYARGFLEERARDGAIVLLLSSAGWILATISFLLRAADFHSRAAGFFLLGAALLILAGVSLSLAPLLAGAKTSQDAARPASTRASQKSAGAKSVGDALRDARDL